MITRPMLAETVEDINTLKYPLLVSPKLDGIRCLIVDGKAVTRKFKPIPNHFVRNWLEANALSGMDGELIVPGKTFNEIQSLIMSEDGEPDFEYHVFDYVSDGLDQLFKDRLSTLCLAVMYYEVLGGNTERIKVVPHNHVSTPAELTYLEEIFLKQGYEGLMVRALDGAYKCGRSTLKQGWLLKVKRFADSEAEILGFEELQNNTNAQEVNELGLTKRSKKKVGMVGANILGKFKVRDIHTGAVFDIGTGDGLTQELRRHIWNNQDKYLGKLIKYKYQPAGQKDLPRFPVWLAFRDERDM